VGPAHSHLLLDRHGVRNRSERPRSPPGVPSVASVAPALTAAGRRCGRFCGGFQDNAAREAAVASIEKRAAKARTASLPPLP